MLSLFLTPNRKSNTGTKTRQQWRPEVSKLFRNVPSLTSLETSPFRFWLFVISSSLALPEAKPCGARRAERLGRSGGQGQRWPRHDGTSVRRSLLHGSADRFSPRVLGRWHPPRFGSRLGARWPSGFHFRHPRPGRRRDLLHPLRAPTVFDGDAAVPSFANQHFAPGGRVMVALRLDLKKAVLIPHHPVVAGPSLPSSRYRFHSRFACR